MRATRTERVDRVLEPPVRQKAKTLRERYNQLRLELEGGYAVAFRAFDEGVAYRFETTLPQDGGPGRRRGGELPLRGRLERLLSRGGELLLPQRAALPPACLEGAQGGRRLASTPAVVDADGVKIAIADADIEDYPGLWLRGTGGAALEAVFPPYPLEEKLERDRDFKVTSRPPTTSR